jgi:hypothetical protein
MRQRSRLLGRFVILVSVLVFLGPAVAHALPGDAQVRAQLAGLRLPFIENQGQTDARVAYYAPTFAGTLFVTRQGELVYVLPNASPGASRGRPTTPSALPAWSLTETLLGGQVSPMAQDPSPTRVSYFRGRDPNQWRREVPSFGQVGLGEVWPGVTVSLLARGRSVEKVFTVSPGASVDDIRVRVGGARAVSVDSSGALVATTGLGPVTYTAPVAYQERDGGRRTVAVAYRLEGNDYRFTVGPYDPTLPLVIDPLLQSSYLGGSAVDRVLGVAIAATGDVYVAGETTSTDFPGTAGGLQDTLAGDSDGFVALLNGALTSLIQATYLGGTGFDAISALAIASSTGDVYVTGRTESTDFPGTAGGAQPTLTGGGSSDAFVVRLNGALTSLIQATYLGGSAFDSAASLALSSANDVYIAGVTVSSNFPGTLGGAQPLPGDGCGGLCSGDAFVARLDSTLTVLTQATYLGGVKEEAATALAVNLTTGDVYVTGETGSTNFPGTLGGAQPASAGAPPVPVGIAEVFVARLNAALTLLLQATYLGGTNNETASSIVIAPGTGEVYVAGPTRSADFPGTAGAAQPALFSGFDAYVARFNSGLTTLLRATYLGGSGTDTAHALAIGPGGDVFVAGRTDSANFPGTTGGAQPAKSVAEDAFVARLSADLTALLQATYIGGSGFDEANAIAIAATNGDVYVAGETHSTNFPGTATGAQPGIGGGNIDAFVSLLASTLTVAAPARNVCCADFDGDGKDDILWRQDTGTVAEWLLNGTSISSVGGPGAATNDWRIAGVGDFNGDGKADLLWRQVPSGTVAVWLLDGTTFLGSGVPGTLGPEWTIVGVGDFDGDGNADILWRDTSGTLLIWFLNGTSIGASGSPGAASTDWQVAGVGDFNGDGKADILWRHTPSGDVAIWLLDGLSIINTGVIGNAPADWQIVGVGDVNHDTKADILWRQSPSGTVFIWLVDGLAVTNSGAIGGASADWRIEGVGDFDGDGNADILWRQVPSGTVAIWLLNGIGITTTGIPGGASFIWQIP